ncbi:MAG: hypothetical protein ABW321_16960 [Polyangiales bacterium]
MPPKHHSPRPQPQPRLTRTARGVVLALAGLLGCSLPHRIAQTATGPEDAGKSGTGGLASAGRSGAAARSGNGGVGAITASPADAGIGCPESLSDRLTVSLLRPDIDIRYKRPGYDMQPRDENVLFSVSPNGQRIALVLRENNDAFILVIKLTAQLTRVARDTIVSAFDPSGLVAHDDGSVVMLVQRPDIGEPLRDTTFQGSMVYGLAVHMIHLRDLDELFDVPLTGTRSITRPRNPSARDCAAPFLNGRLAWNGAKYGAYFAVHGCEGDAHEPLYGDKLVYVSDTGEFLPGGWDWNCTISQGMRLLPGPSTFTSLCMADTLPAAGLNLVTEGVPSRQLAPERAENGYSAGTFGSLLRLDDGSFLVGWTGRGVTPTAATEPRPSQALRQANDIAILHLAADYSVTQPLTWLTATPEIAETNLHVALYGPNRLLILWDAIEGLSCTERTCWGTYTGTFARLVDYQGNRLTPDTPIDAPPNSEQDLVIFPDGDIGWAFVPDDSRNYAAPLTTSNGVPNVPVKRTVGIARLRYCE